MKKSRTTSWIIDYVQIFSLFLMLLLGVFTVSFTTTLRNTSILFPTDPLIIFNSFFSSIIIGLEITVLVIAFIFFIILVILITTYLNTNVSLVKKVQLELSFQYTDILDSCYLNPEKKEG